MKAAPGRTTQLRRVSQPPLAACHASADAIETSSAKAKAPLFRSGC